MSSIFDSPNKMYFGMGTSKEIGAKLKGWNCQKVMLVYDQGIKKSGLVEGIAESIEAAGIEMVIFDRVEANAPSALVDEAGQLGLDEQIDGIVAIGGGSSMDTGKGVRILRSYPGPISNYYAKLDSKPLNEDNMVPLLVVPTTAGTGSESTPGAVITDSVTHKKAPVICGISLAVIDPMLTLGLPAHITASTGFDALCHAVEAVTSRLHNPLSETVGKEAIRLVGKYLVTAVKDGSNLEAREGMSLAATLAGMSLRGPFGGIPHDLGSPIGMVYPVPHGTAVSFILPEAVEFIAPAAPDQVKLVGESLGIDFPSDASSETIGALTSGRIKEMYTEVGLPALKSVVPSKEDLLGNIDTFYKGSFFSPRALEKTDALEMLAKAYDRG